MNELIGTVIDGRFEVVRSIGKGGYGDVFEAVQLSVDRRVALKVVHRHLAERSDVSERFRREARLTSRLDHPNAVGVIDFGDDGGLLYLVMDFVQGPTLKQRLREEERLEPGVACEIASGVAAALHAAHSIGLVHRDLKPSNVILAEGADGLRPVVIDFGLVKAFTEEPDSEEVTASHMMIGTPAYMSPENVLGRKVDGRSDLYALGVLLFEMLSGERPFSGTTPLETATSRLQGPVPRLSEEHPESLRNLTDALLAKRPEERLPTAKLAVEHLRNWHRAGYTPTRLLKRDLTIAPTRGPGASHSELATDLTAPTALPQPPTAAPSAKRRGGLLLAALMATLMAVAGIFLGITTERTSNGQMAVAEPGGSVDPNGDAEVLNVGSATDGTADGALVAEQLQEPAYNEAHALPTPGIPAAVTRNQAEFPQLDDPGAESGQAKERTPENDAATEENPDRTETQSEDGNELEPSREVRASRDRDDDEADSPGLLRVNIDPFGDVLVDGESVGGAPQTIELSPGQYTVTTRYSESSRTESVRIRSGATVDVTHRY